MTKTAKGSRHGLSSFVALSSFILLPLNAFASTDKPPTMNFWERVCRETGYFCYPKASLELTFGVVSAAGQSQNPTADEKAAPKGQQACFDCIADTGKGSPPDAKTQTELNYALLNPSDRHWPEQEQPCNDSDHISKFKAKSALANPVDGFVKSSSTVKPESIGFIDITFPRVSKDVQFEAYIRYFSRTDNNKLTVHSSDYLLKARADAESVGCQLMFPVPIDRYGSPDYMEPGTYTVEVDLINGLNGTIRKEITIKDPGSKHHRVGEAIAP